MVAKEILKELLGEALKKMELSLPLSVDEVISNSSFEIPKNEKHGDYASNVAFILASRLKQSPLKVAQKLLPFLDRVDFSSVIKEVKIADPGFINFFFKDNFWYEQLKIILTQGEGFGKADLGKGKRIQIEFVSANPTGPLHIGHGRGAALGDALASILSFVGYQVTKEYYINDVGNQMETLGRSVFYRYQELFSRSTEFPEDHYQGEYIYDIARKAIELWGDRYLENKEKEVIPVFSQLAKEVILGGIKQDLEDFRVNFDSWFSEKELIESGELEDIIAELKKRGLLYEKDGAWWFPATKFEDEKDRVVIRSNGQKTYFASDIAYHKNKFSRNFDYLINIWGADHHGYVPRLKAMIKALGYDPERLRVLLVQMVSLVREGKSISMSTRQGEFISLREVLSEVGSDVTRYLLLTRKSDVPLEFDLELAKKQSDENPVYYVQYAHARLCSILRLAQERGIDIDNLVDANISLLTNPEELALIKKISHFPEVVEGSALSLEPHRLTIFLQDLVSAFHRYYHSGKLEGERRVLTSDLTLSRARLSLVIGLKITIKNALSLLGVSAPERM